MFVKCVDFRYYAANVNKMDSVSGADITEMKVMCPVYTVKVRNLNLNLYSNVM